MHRLHTVCALAAALAVGVPAVASADAISAEWKVSSDYMSNERLGLTDSSGLAASLYVETPRWHGFSLYGWGQVGRHDIETEFDPALTWQRGADGKNIHAFAVAYFNKADKPIYSESIGTEFPVGPFIAEADFQRYDGGTFKDSVISLGARKEFVLASWFKPTIEIGKAWNTYERREPIYGRIALPLTEHVTVQLRGYHVEPRGLPKETRVLAEVVTSFNPLSALRTLIGR